MLTVFHFGLARPFLCWALPLGCQIRLALVGAWEPGNVVKVEDGSFFLGLPVRE